MRGEVASSNSKLKTAAPAKRNGALSECDLAHEPGVGTTRTYQPGEMLLSNRPRPGLRSTHQAIHQK